MNKLWWTWSVVGQKGLMILWKNMPMRFLVTCEWKKMDIQFNIFLIWVDPCSLQ